MKIKRENYWKLYFLSNFPIGQVKFEGKIIRFSNNFSEINIEIIFAKAIRSNIY